MLALYMHRAIRPREPPEIAVGDVFDAHGRAGVSGRWAADAAAAVAPLGPLGGRAVVLVDADTHTDVPELEVLEGHIPHQTDTAAPSLDPRAIRGVGQGDAAEADVGDDLPAVVPLAEAPDGDAFPTFQGQVLAPDAMGVLLDDDVIIPALDVAVSQDDVPRGEHADAVGVARTEVVWPGDRDVGALQNNTPASQDHQVVQR
mmetsp:Transcript_11418/g.23104  ORF Transcript_11418/g.23104 Transcript_11418/m.23104 type:complete len:202 (-) Transcript_11418:88-693(-)